MDQITFSLTGGTPVVLKREIPPHLQHLVMPGSIAFAAQDWFGTMLYQVVKLAGCSLGYWVFDCTSNVSFCVQRERAFTLLLVALEQQAHCFLYGLGNITLPAAGSYILHLPELNAVLHCTKGKRYGYVGLEFAPEVYHSFAPEFPLLNSFLQETGEQPNYCYSYLDTPCMLPGSTMQLVTGLVTAGYTNKAHLQYGSLQAKAALQLLLGESNFVPEGNAAPFAILHQLRKGIQADPLHAPDFNKAALKYHIGKAKLVKDFKALYHLPPYHYWQYYRMQFYATRQIMETHKKVKGIVIEMGFGKESGNFSRKFKSYCGVTAGRYKKMHS